MKRRASLREIEIVAAFVHHNILPLHDSGNADGHLYYVMPWVDGGSLRERLNEERQLPWRRPCRSPGGGRRLSYAHKRGVVHRDIKPENILLEHGHPVVVDFGVARALSVLRDEYSTGAGMAMGTPAYMSPEQASADGMVDHRADQYAPGCVLYEMLAGHSPFAGGSTRAVLVRHVSDPPPPLATVRSGVPRPVRQALTRALAKVPADRFASVRKIAEALVAQDTDADADADAGSSIAVLPFINMSGNAEDDYFGDGMAEEIITALTRIEGLRVASLAYAGWSCGRMSGARSPRRQRLIQRRMTITSAGGSSSISVARRASSSHGRCSSAPSSGIRHMRVPMPGLPTPARCWRTTIRTTAPPQTSSRPTWRAGRRWR